MITAPTITIGSDFDGAAEHERAQAESFSDPALEAGGAT